MNINKLVNSVAYHSTYGNINVDNVSITQWSVIGNSMTCNIVN